MYISQLTDILENILVIYENLYNLEIKDHLSNAIKNKKYDMQDQALIEAIINDEEKQLVKSLEGSYLEMVNKFNEKYGSVSNTDPQIICDEVISVFITNLEYYIDYFYNSLLNKHFTSG